MSVEAMLWALRTDQCSGTEKVVLIGIGSHADAEGDNAWPSIETLAKYANVSRRNVQRALDGLVEKGLISIERQAGGTHRTREDRRPNLYQCHLDGVTETTPRGGGGGTERGGAGDADGVAPATPESSLEPSSSSLRSEISTAKAEQDAVARQIATDYWDWHKTENGGAPAQDFKALMSVARAALKRDYPADEILAAMKLERRALTTAKVIERIGATRRANENRPSTATIDPRLVRAWSEIERWLHLKFPYAVNGDVKVRLMSEMTMLMKWGFDVGETIVRLAVLSHAVPLSTITAMDLSNVRTVPRFEGTPADIERTMETAYKNKRWVA